MLFLAVFIYLYYVLIFLAMILWVPAVIVELVKEFSRKPRLHVRINGGIHNHDLTRNNHKRYNKEGRKNTVEHIDN